MRLGVGDRPERQGHVQQRWGITSEKAEKRERTKNRRKARKRGGRGRVKSFGMKVKVVGRGGGLGEKAES